MLPRGHDDIRETIERERFHTVFQPIYSLHTGAVVGLEALTRVTGSAVGPATWFAAAHAVGLGVDLELAAARRALLSATEAPPGVRVWINLCVDALADPRVEDALTAHPVPALGVEITDRVTAPAALDGLRAHAATLQRGGVHIAVDDLTSATDAAAMLAALGPDQVKVDLSVTRALEGRRRSRRHARRLLAAAHRRGAAVVAEGVETPAQLERWARLGADAAQGFLLAHPAPFGDALAAAGVVGLAGHRAPAGAQRTA